MNDLSKQQQECLTAIRTLWANGNTAPTYQQVGDLIDRTRERVRQHAVILREKGYLDGSTTNLVAPGTGNRLQQKVDAAYDWLVANYKVDTIQPRGADLPASIEIYVSDLRRQGRIHDSKWIVPTCFPEFTTKDEFWFHVDKSEGPDGCWPYKRNIGPEGYGHLATCKYGEESKGYAHRAAFLYSGGVLTEDNPWVLHKCDNPICCNPKHLYAGNAQDNAQDRESRNRTIVRRMPEHTALKVKQMISQKIPLTEIAKEVGYCYATVYNLARGKTHRNIMAVDNVKLEVN